MAPHPREGGRLQRDPEPLDGRDPYEDKVLSYQRDRRNVYGENDKSSRKAIRFRKAWVNRTYRRTTHEALGPGDPDLIDERLLKVRRPHWRKLPDAPIGLILEHKRRRRAEAEGANPPEASPAELAARRRRRNIPPW